MVCKSVRIRTLFFTRIYTHETPTIIESELRGCGWICDPNPSFRSLMKKDLNSFLFSFENADWHQSYKWHQKSIEMVIDSNWMAYDYYYVKWHEKKFTWRPFTQMPKWFFEHTITWRHLQNNPYSVHYNDVWLKC